MIILGLFSDSKEPFEHDPCNVNWPEKHCPGETPDVVLEEQDESLIIVGKEFSVEKENSKTVEESLLTELQSSINNLPNVGKIVPEILTNVEAQDSKSGSNIDWLIDDELDTSPNSHQLSGGNHVENIPVVVTAVDGHHPVVTAVLSWSKEDLEEQVHWQEQVGHDFEKVEIVFIVNDF